MSFCEEKKNWAQQHQERIIFFPKENDLIFFRLKFSLILNFKKLDAYSHTKHAHFTHNNTSNVTHKLGPIETKIICLNLTPMQSLFLMSRTNKQTAIMYRILAMPIITN